MSRGNLNLKTFLTSVVGRGERVEVRGELSNYRPKSERTVLLSQETFQRPPEDQWSGVRNGRNLRVNT